jgi:hypothetical protein
MPMGRIYFPLRLASALHPMHVCGTLQSGFHETNSKRVVAAPQ